MSSLRHCIPNAPDARPPAPGSALCVARLTLLGKESQVCSRLSAKGSRLEVTIPLCGTRPGLGDTDGDQLGRFICRGKTICGIHHEALNTALSRCHVHLSRPDTVHTTSKSETHWSFGSLGLSSPALDHSWNKPNMEHHLPAPLHKSRRGLGISCLSRGKSVWLFPSGLSLGSSGTLSWGQPDSSPYHTTTQNGVSCINYSFLQTLSEE